MGTSKNSLHFFLHIITAKASVPAFRFGGSGGFFTLRHIAALYSLINTMKRPWQILL